MIQYFWMLTCLPLRFCPPLNNTRIMAKSPNPENFNPWCCVVVVIITHNLIQLSLNSGSVQVQTLSQCVRDLRWWGSLTIVPAGNKTRPLSSVNHTAKAIHHLHHQLSTAPNPLRLYWFDSCRRLKLKSLPICWWRYGESVWHGGK